MMRSFALASIITMTLAGTAYAQDAAAPVPEYATRPDAPQPGMAPGLKVIELNPQTRNFNLVFAKGDEVGAGLYEFANKNHLTNAHFTALGALGDAVIGWFDADKKAYKVIHLNEEMEIASFVGNITRDRTGNPVVHGHIVVALFRNGQVYAGHLISGHISLTMQMYLEDSEPLSSASASAK